MLGLLIGLIGFAIVACVPATQGAKELRAQAKAAKAALTVRPVPADLHEEHNLLPGYSGAEQH